EAVAMQVSLGQGDEPPSLAPVDALQRFGQAVSFAASHLDKDQHIPVPRDDIDLAPAQADIALCDAVSLGAQKPRRQFLAQRSETAPLLGHGASPSLVGLAAQKTKAHAMKRGRSPRPEGLEVMRRGVSFVPVKSVL